MSPSSPSSPVRSLGSRLGPSLPIGVLVISLVVLISFPLPSFVLDVLVALNLIAGILLLLSVLYIRSIVEFSTFAILLLITTIFRLATSVSTTRAILSGGDPGDVIKTFGELVVGGSVAVGLIVFLIIAIVQFIVITKGAERIAEVAARFNLDAMPGRQMSIEADIRAGAISQEQAGRLRESLRAESQIIGSLDGSMKFVKGDSIASFVIVFVNLLGGIAVGVGVIGMSFAEAGRLYSVYTIGDGLVAQIPSILSAVAAGIFVSRAGSESRENVVSQITTELAANQTIFAIVAGLLAIAGLVPGMPLGVFWTLSTMIAVALVANRYSNPPASREDPINDKTNLELGKYSDPYLCRVSSETLDFLNSRKFSVTINDATRRRVTQTGIGLPLLLFDADQALPPQKLRLVFEGVIDDEIKFAENENLDLVADKVVSRLVRRFITNFGPPDTTYYLQQIDASYPHIKDAIQSWPSGLLDRTFQRMLMDGISIAHPRPIVQSISESLGDGVDSEDEIYKRLRLALRDRIIAGVTGADGKASIRKLPESLQSLALEASLASNDLSGLMRKEQAFVELTRAMSAQAHLMANATFVARDDIRATCAEAARKVNIECMFLGSTEASNIPLDDI